MMFRNQQSEEFVRDIAESVGNVLVGKQAFKDIHSILLNTIFQIDPRMVVHLECKFCLKDKEKRKRSVEISQQQTESFAPVTLKTLVEDIQGSGDVEEEQEEVVQWLSPEDQGRLWFRCQTGTVRHSGETSEEAFNSMPSSSKLFAIVDLKYAF